MRTEPFNIHFRPQQLSSSHSCAYDFENVSIEADEAECKANEARTKNVPNSAQTCLCTRSTHASNSFISADFCNRFGSHARRSFAKYVTNTNITKRWKCSYFQTEHNALGSSSIQPWLVEERKQIEMVIAWSGEKTNSTLVGLVRLFGIFVMISNKKAVVDYLRDYLGVRFVFTECTLSGEINEQRTLFVSFGCVPIQLPPFHSLEKYTKAFDGSRR